MQNQPEKEENFFEKYSNYLDILKNISFPLIKLRNINSDQQKSIQQLAKKQLQKNLNSQNVNKKMSYIMPKKEDSYKKTLVLDLDETLIHSSEKIPKVQHNYIQLQNSNNDYIDVYVIIRPGAKQFIQEMSKYYEIVIFTASIPLYANDIIDLLDENGKYISGRFFRDKCIQGGIKNLELLERNLKEVIIIDNLQKSFELQPDNGLLIKTFIDDMTDYSLIELIPYLKYLSQVDDVRNVTQQKIQFDEEKIQSQTPNWASKKNLSFNTIEKMSTTSTMSQLHEHDEDESEDIEDDDFWYNDGREQKLQKHIFETHFMK